MPLQEPIEDLLDHRHGTRLGHCPEAVEIGPGSREDMRPSRSCAAA